MTEFSLGRVAIAICDRCHFKHPYSALRSDGNSSGLRVCNECWDEKDRWRLPRPTEKPISLRFPRPDLNLTVPGGYVVSDQQDSNMLDPQVYVCTEDGERIVVG